MRREERRIRRGASLGDAGGGIWGRGAGEIGLGLARGGGGREGGRRGGAGGGGGGGGEGERKERDLSSGIN